MDLRRKRLWLGALTIGVLLVVSSVGIVQTSKTSFCLSCHEMQVYQTELEASPHAKDADGKPIGCAQCHIPGGNLVRMVAAKGYMGVKDLWVHYTGEPYDLDRRSMQVAAKRFTDDANCLKCHTDLYKNAKNDGPISLEGKLAHEAYEGKNGQARSNCAGCHMNMAHLPVFDQRIPRNAKFLKKLTEQASIKELK